MAKDNWSSEAYRNAASFVPQLTLKVVEYLDPQSTDAILDIGCGDGVLNDKIAPRCSRLIGLDSSASMIQTANETVKPKHSNVEFHVADCRRVVGDSGTSTAAYLAEKSYDKVFSNAAMHWILRDETTRVPFFFDVFRLLKPQGTFAFEMGGFQNVAEVHTAIYAVLRLQHGVKFNELRAADPWFFPSLEWMRATLEGAGFSIEKLEMEHRPTKLNAQQDDGSAGAEGWIRLMAANFLQVLDEGDRENAVRAIGEASSQAMTKVEDGSKWLSYVRLRCVARKP